MPEYDLVSLLDAGILTAAFIFLLVVYLDKKMTNFERWAVILTVVLYFTLVIYQVISKPTVYSGPYINSQLQVAPMISSK